LSIYIYFWYVAGHNHKILCGGWAICW